MTTLILTRSDDAVVPELVAAALSHLGERDVVRVDTDRYPDELWLADDGDGAILGLADGRELELRAVRAVWRRRPWPAARIDCDPAFARAAAAQARAAFDAVFDRLAEERSEQGVAVVNDPTSERLAEHKPRQLGLARRLGFVVPETLITNDPARARAFITRAAADGVRVVTKLLVPLSSTMRGDGPFVYTTTLDDDDVAALDALRVAPQIFQRRVEKVLDVRVQVMGDDVVAGATPCTSDDWRIASSGRFSPWPIDEALADRCRALCRGLGLATGAIDLVVDDAGVASFLEVNPAGEWGFLERDLGRGLPRSLARLLLGVTS